MPTPIHCYKCSSIMQTVLIDGVCVDFCPNCLSFWLDKSDMEFLFNISRHYSANVFYKTAPKVLKLTYTGVCPKCGCSMKTEEHDGIMIDKCTCCEGIFFDYCEFEEFMKKHNWQYNIKRFLVKILNIFY